MSLFASTRPHETRSRSWPDWVMRAAGVPAGRKAAFSVRSPEQALQIATVWACVRLLATTVAQQPLDVMRRASVGGQPIEVFPTPRVIAKPSALVPSLNWRYSSMVSLLLRGNVYGFVTDRDPRLGYPTQIELAHPDTVQCDQPDQFAPASWKINGNDIDPDDMFHVAAYTIPGFIQGLSPITHARRSLAISEGSGDYSEDFYTGGGHPTAILSNTAEIDEDSSKLAKKRFVDATQGDRLAVLGQGWSYDTVQISPADAAWLEARNSSAVEICNYFGVQPEKLSIAQSGSSVTYANREQRAIDQLTDGVQWWFSLLDAAYTDLLPAGQYVRHNVDSYLRVDAKTRAEVQAIRLRSGQRTPNEVRVKDDLGPYPGDLGDIPAWPPPGADPSQEGASDGTQNKQGS